LSINIYQANITTYQQDLKLLKAKSARIAWARFACIVVAGVLVALQWPSFSALHFIGIFISLLVFLRLVIMAINTNLKIDHTNHLMAINEEEIAIVSGKFQQRYDGKDFLPPVHDYAQDLDLFGRASLYQYTQRAETETGRREWAEWLLQPASPEEIVARQVAAKQLANQLTWRQQLQATGREFPLSAAVEARLLEWQTFEDPHFSKKGWQVIRWLGPAVSISIFMAWLANLIPTSSFNVYLIIFFAITAYISKLATPAYSRLGKLANEIKTFSCSLGCIEQMPTGDSSWLHQRKEAVHPAGALPASEVVLKLNGILKRMDYRLNPVVFVPLNILFFWDVQQMLQLVKWQRQNAEKLSDWLKVLGETEAISGIAALAFNQPAWVFPELDTAHGTFQTKLLGHPLIDANKRVTSDFGTKGVPMVNIITGSNMAGKSTFLRSIGLAMVMGQAGAPVCAAAARISHMRLISSMRIADNLEENTSTFYAELKKLKLMIDAVNAGEKVLLLMDEILRGTNSLDRHKGSKALIEQLIHHSACGLVATHDLELAELSGQYPAAISNYHFDVQVAGEELYFDYALKTGVCQSMNASILMKKIGIELG
jgi:hypothetical protein